MNDQPDATPSPHRSFAALMELSFGVFRKGDCRLFEKQAQSHRAAAEASLLPAVRAHRTGLADNLENTLAAHRAKQATDN